MEELLRLDAVEDSTISASLAKKTVTIMVTIDAPSAEGAAAIGMSAIRAAFHAAGAATPDWPLFDELSIGAGEAYRRLSPSGRDPWRRTAQAVEMRGVDIPEREPLHSCSRSCWQVTGGTLMSPPDASPPNVEG